MENNKKKDIMRGELMIATLVVEVVLNSSITLFDEQKKTLNG